MRCAPYVSSASHNLTLKSRIQAPVFFSLSFCVLGPSTKCWILYGFHCNWSRLQCQVVWHHNVTVQQGPLAVHLQCDNKSLLCYKLQTQLVEKHMLQPFDYVKYETSTIVFTFWQVFTLLWTHYSYSKISSVLCYIMRREVVWSDIVNMNYDAFWLFATRDQ